MPRSFRSRPFVFFAALIVIAGFTPAFLQAQGRKAKPLFSSNVITTKTPGHAVEIDVEIKGAKQLALVVTDGGDGFGCDWADWAEPRLVGPQGEKKLTDIKWKSARTDWGQVRVNKNADGGAMKINGKPVEYGIGTHAQSLILFDLPVGYTRFRARAGLDNGGTDQGGGGSSSAKFLVFADPNPRALAALVQPKAGGGGNQGNLPPGEALDGLDVAEDLEVTLFAHEPMTLSPSNIDVDHRGRVWVCEIVNYRQFRNKDTPERKEGDRILILEDTTGDRKADKQTVFYQGRDIDSAHGVCVLGNKAIVSAGDSVFIFTDSDGDDKADKKEVLFTGISGTQHDHGIHSFLFGPDGKLYFNFGNEGKQIKDKNGKPIVDQAGNIVNNQRKPYQEGMVFRCNLDGSEFETLGWNFRNNWELAVDSFGTIWQSDNDDDGNRGVRINFVMEFGNYGYKDEFTGAGWKSPRTGMHEEIPKRHWHLNDPGVVPNLLQTGAGSPTGICVYEGDLLPKRYHGQLIHCDAGPNIVRAYLIKNDGAGYKATIDNILEGTRDQWFRPSDVCVAPDGSLIIADWYDPGVGGHRMGDIQKGRIFRVAPPKAEYGVPEFDFKTPEGTVEALKNPNLATRYLAWTALHVMGEKAEPALKKMFNDKSNPRYRARALWLLGQLPKKGEEYALQAVKDDDPNIRIAGLRLARQVDDDRDLFPVLVLGLVGDSSPQVRRECAIALRTFPLEKETNRNYAASVWRSLALKHEAGDRWGLEALGIAAENNWDACLVDYLKFATPQWVTDEAKREIIWRSRARRTPELLAEIILDPKTPRNELPRYFRALDLLTHQVDTVNDAVVEIAFAELAGDAERAAFISREAFDRLKNVDTSDARVKTKLNSVLDGAQGTEQFVNLVARFNVKDRYPELLALAQSKPTEQVGVEAMRALLAKNQLPLITKAVEDDNAEKAISAITALGNAGDKKAENLLWNLIDDAKKPLAIRRAAVTAAAKSRSSAMRLARLAAGGKINQEIKDATASALHTAQWPDIKAQAAKLFPLPATKNNKPLPPIEQLVKRQGDAKVGRVLYNTTATCNKCHIVNNVGREVGPDLSEIGKKLSREALYQSILFPSAGISHNYESYLIALTNGTTVTGLVPSRTDEEISVKDIEGLTRTYKMEDVEIIKKQNLSLMPADLQKVMSEEDLVNVVEYLTTLREAKKLGKKEE